MLAPLPKSRRKREKRTTVEEAARKVQQKREKGKKMEKRARKV